jgi:hypothetical protein
MEPKMRENKAELMEIWSVHLMLLLGQVVGVVKEWTTGSPSFLQIL